jgi:hypothetical protein
MKIEEELLARSRRVPPHQAHESDPVLFAKLYWSVGKARWFIAQYDHRLGIAYGFVVGVGADEWGYFSIPELLASSLAGVDPLRLDASFQPTKASRIGVPPNRN